MLEPGISIGSQTKKIDRAKLALDVFFETKFDEYVKLNTMLGFEDLQVLTKMAFEFGESYYALMDKKLAARDRGIAEPDFNYDDEKAIISARWTKYVCHFHTRLRAGEIFGGNHSSADHVPLENSPAKDVKLDLGVETARFVLGKLMRRVMDVAKEVYPMDILITSNLNLPDIMEGLRVRNSSARRSSPDQSAVKQLLARDRDRGQLAPGGLA